MKIFLTFLVFSVLFVGTTSAQTRPNAIVSGVGGNAVLEILFFDPLPSQRANLIDPKGVAINPDGKTAYVADLNNNDSLNVSVIKTSDFTMVETVNITCGNSTDCGTPFYLAVTPDGKFVYVASGSLQGAVYVIRTSDNTLVDTVDVGGGQPIGVAVTPDGKFVYATNAELGNVSKIDRSSNKVVATVDVAGGQGQPFGVAVTPDGKFVYVANFNSNNVIVIDVATDTVVETVPVGRVPQGIAVTPDGKFVYVGSSPISVIEVATNKVVDTVDLENNATGVAVTPDSKFVYVTNGDEVTVIETSDNKVDGSVKLDTPWGIAVVPDTDNDGVANGIDADSDNDGIPDSMETATNQTNALNSTRMEIPEGTDGDGIPNERDLDSDGDGLPDHIEGGGDNDMNSDGTADGFVDSDGDGLHDAHDPPQGGTLLPLPDTDGDVTPDFADRDSDNDDLSDTNETVNCIDANDDGILDNSGDGNNDGLADSVHPETGEPCVLLDSDGDGLFDHLDEEDSRGNGSSSCAIAPSTASNISFPVYMLLPAFILIARLWRKRSN
ncbi:beta-propeller fold lactonase family protein [Desulfobacterota bacterium AH_259_B03_O07]|nr:beta-propeller fold lactonase family protein [Desulfobacterota bacterium AH_259_B03_O07]